MNGAGGGENHPFQAFQIVDGHPPRLGPIPGGQHRGEQFLGREVLLPRSPAPEKMPHQMHGRRSPVGGVIDQPGEVGGVLPGRAAAQGEAPAGLAQPGQLSFQPGERADAPQPVVMLRPAVETDL